MKHPPSFISRQVESGRYYYGDLSVPPGVELALACAGVETCSAEYRIEREGFPYVALEVVQSGRWELSFGGETQVLGPGSAFFYGPGFVYSLVPIDGKPLRKYFLDLTGTGSNELLERYQMEPGQVVLGMNRPERLFQIFDQLVDCAELPSMSARRMSLHLAELVLMRIQVDRREGSGHHGQSYESYLRAREVMRERHVSLMRVEEVAQACGVHPAYLSRLFKRYSDEGALQFLTRLRMQHAADLLVRGGTNVQETAAAMGFEDPFHFSRVFKRVHGVSPRAFVKSGRGGR